MEHIIFMYFELGTGNIATRRAGNKIKLAIPQTFNEVWRHRSARGKQRQTESMVDGDEQW